MADRAVSAVVNYVTVLLIVSLLGSGLFITATDYVQAQQSAAIRAQFEDVGNDLAADLEHADRLTNATDGDATVNLRSDLPDRVAGSTYRITIRDSGTLVLESAEPDVTVVVPFRTSATVTETTVNGGPLVVHAERVGGDHSIEVRHG